MIMCVSPGDHTKRTRVVGITAPAAGVIKLMASQPGIVVERDAEEGQVAKAGEVLFVLSTERLTGAGTNGGLGVAGAQGAVLEQIERRRAGLVEEQGRQSRINAEQTAAVQIQLADLDAQAAQIDRELATERALRTGDLPPACRTSVKVVESVLQEKDGHEEEPVHRRTDHRVLEAGRGRRADQGPVSQGRLGRRNVLRVARAVSGGWTCPMPSGCVSWRPRTTSSSACWPKHI
jgi:hypothetical protein